MSSKDKPIDGGMDWAAFDALTDDEVEAAARADPDAQPLTDEELARMRRPSPARLARHKLRMTPEDFARTYGIPLDTLRAWERGEAEPTPAEATYLKAILHAPEAVRSAVHEAAE